MSNLIPDGRYPCKVIAAQYGQSEVKGTDYVRITVQITDGPFKDRTMFRDYYFTDATWKRSLETLRDLGFKGEDVCSPEEIVGVAATVGVTQKITENKDKTIRTDATGKPIWHNEVSFIGRDSRPKVKDAASKESFRELMRARIQQAKAEEQGASGDAAPDLSRQPGDDDLPDFMKA